MRRSVITGIGVVSAIGIGLEAYWKGLEQGVCGIGPVSVFDTSGFRGKLGAEARGFDFEASRKAIMRHAPEGFRFDRLSRCDRLGLAAAVEAVEDSGIDFKRIDPERVAVVLGSGGGGLMSGEIFRRIIYQKGRGHPALLTSFTAASFTDLIGQAFGFRGLRSTISTACSSSSTAIGIAGDIIRRGEADIVITGGSEALAETTFSGFNSLRAVDEVPCRPFDKDRKGISLGEGAAIFVIESSEERKSSKRPYAELGGYGLTADAYHATAPSPEGIAVSRAILDAMERSGLAVGDIGYINAHGTGTEANDLAETNAIKAAFGRRAYAIPVSSTKSMIGHCLGAAGAMEAAAAIMAIHMGVIPPTANYKTPDPACDLDYVPVESRRAKVNAALSNSLAFGGNNTSILLRAPQ